MRIPIFGVDPTVVGPRELARRKKEQLIQWARQPIISVALVAVAGLLGYGLMTAGVSIPEAPNWVSVALITTAVGSVVAWRVGGRLASEIHESDAVYLSELNVYDGDQRIVKVSPERFRDITVVNHKWDPGEEPFEDAIVGRERLKRVEINGKSCLECDQYDPVLNVAVTSWQSGRTNNEIRQDHATLEYIKTEQDYQIDKVYELLSNETQIHRKAVAKISNKVIRVAQDVDLPQGNTISVHETLNELFEEEGLDDEMRDSTADHTETDEEIVEEQDGAEMTDIEVSDP